MRISDWSSDVCSSDLRGEHVVIAAGTATPGIARRVALDVPVRPQRGQILVTERLAPILPMPSVPIRQTAEGTVLIGSTQEEVGFDTGTTGEAAARMAARAVDILPVLRDAVVVRQRSEEHTSELHH